MSSLKALERRRLEEWLGMSGGYVLDFSNRTFDEFFAELGISIFDDKYQNGSGSKAQRLRAFWDLESDELVAKVLLGLVDVWRFENNQSGVDGEILAIIARLGGSQPTVSIPADEAFLQLKYADISFTELGLADELVAVLDSRLSEAKSCVSSAPLATVFLCGSMLEGLLLGVARQRPSDFNQASAAPKDNAGHVRQFHSWSLAELINVAHGLGLLSLDVKRHSHALRDFRNYIHPYQQVKEKFTPDSHTAEISIQVLKAAVGDFAGSRAG